MTDLHVRLREWEVVGPDDKGGLGLRGASLQSAEARAIATLLTREQKIEVDELRDGLRIRARAHVGRVRLGGVVITIEPKLASNDLLALVRYAYQLGAWQRYDTAEYATTGSLLQDLLVAQLLAEVRELVARGLSRRYVPRAEWLESPRGRIDMGALARRGPLLEPAVPCQHHPRSANHLLNRLLVAGLELAAHVASDPALRASARRQVAALGEDAHAVRLDATMLRRTWNHVDRLTKPYAPALSLVEILYAGSSISLEADATTRLPGFLFDMNRFFQAIIGRLLADFLDDFEVLNEHTLNGMMRYMPERNPRNRRAPLPRPDFAVRRGGKVMALVDAKYRDLWERDLPREMLYQLAMYAMSAPGSTSAIIFPTTTEAATDAVVEIKDAAGGSVLGFVALRPLVVPRLVPLLAADRRAAAAAVVRALAFGGSEDGRAVGRTNTSAREDDRGPHLLATP